MNTEDLNIRLLHAITGSEYALGSSLSMLTGASKLSLYDVSQLVRILDASYSVLGKGNVLSYVKRDDNNILTRILYLVEHTVDGLTPEEFFDCTTEPPVDLSESQKLLLDTVSRLASTSIEALARMLSQSTLVEHLKTLTEPLVKELLLQGVGLQYKPSEVEIDSIHILLLLPALLLGALTESLPDGSFVHSRAFASAILSHIDPEHPEILPAKEVFMSYAASI